MLWADEGAKRVVWQGLVWWVRRSQKFFQRERSISRRVLFAWNAPDVTWSFVVVRKLANMRRGHRCARNSSPLADQFDILLRKLRIAMNRSVVAERHPALGDRVADEHAFAFRGRLSCPVEEVQNFAALIDVLGDQPGNRRDMAVPWPRRAVGVAVLT